MEEKRKYIITIPENGPGSTVFIECLTDRQMQEPDPEPGALPGPSLDTLQRRVRGYIEHVRIILNPGTKDLKRYDGWVNEEGRIFGMQPNPLASLLYGGEIYGPMVITGDDGWGGSPALTFSEATVLAQQILGAAIISGEAGEIRFKIAKDNEQKGGKGNGRT